MSDKRERTALYRFYAADQQLLYVGITSKPGERWEAHMRSQVWWDEAARQTVEWHPTREAALNAERTAIRNERPLYNAKHSLGLSTLALKSAWTCPACRWQTADPVEQVEHMEHEIAKLSAGQLPSEDVERLTRIVERASNALDRAEASLARALTLFAQATNSTPQRETRQMLPAEAQKLLDDLCQILGDDRVRLSELPVLLRQHDPNWLPYRKLKGKDVHTVLKEHGVRVTNTGNVPRLDPADLPRRTA